jgi:hypothetical protein
VLLVDVANTVGSRPTGWWKDRAGATRDFTAKVRAAVAAGHLLPPVVMVVEGAARAGAEEGEADGVRVVHAHGSGDDALAALASNARGQVVLVSADRELGERVRAVGGDVVGPSWLLGKLV